MASKLHHGIKKFVMTSKIHIKFVVMSTLHQDVKNTSLRRKV